MGGGRRGWRGGGKGNNLPVWMKRWADTPESLQKINCGGAHHLLQTESDSRRRQRHRSNLFETFPPFDFPRRPLIGRAPSPLPFNFLLLFFFFCCFLTSHKVDDWISLPPHPLPPISTPSSDRQGRNGEARRQGGDQEALLHQGWPPGGILGNQGVVGGLGGGRRGEA